MALRGDFSSVSHDKSMRAKDHWGMAWASLTKQLTSTWCTYFLL